MTLYVLRALISLVPWGLRRIASTALSRDADGSGR